MTSAAEARAAQMFAIDVLTDGGHEMSVPMSDGRYRRHLRFRRPDTGLYWFDIVTWPNTLVFDGDMGTWLFRRHGTGDMLRFFAGTRINPGYWAEKVQAGKTREYDPDRLREYVTEEFDAHALATGTPLAKVGRAWSYILREVLGAETEEAARLAVQQFELMDPAARNRTEFVFTPDAWEWELRGFTHHYLYACFAIQWAVNRYLGLPQPDLSDLTATLAPAPRPAGPALSTPPDQPITIQPRPEIL